MPAMDGNELDPRLEEAARRSPEVAAMIAGGRRAPGPRYRRIATLVGAAALGVGGVWLAASTLRHRAPPSAGDPAAEIDRSVYLLPLKTEASPQGEETAPFSGFAVSIDSEPPGAVVSIAGKVRGEAPVLANVACARGDRVEVRAERKGFRAVRREIACRADTLVKLTLRLER